MSTIIKDDELVRRAFIYVTERLQELQNKGNANRRILSELLDDAGAHFNLSPLRSERLTALVARWAEEQGL